MKKEWDRNEWQGRSEEQVNSNAEITATTVIASIAVVLIAIVMYIVSNL